LKRSKKFRPPSQPANNTEQAVGRIIGSLCVLTAKQGEVTSGMLASWVSQATFNPPGLTVAVAKDRAVESLTHIGDSFALNILQEGKQLRKHFMKKFAPGEDRFAGVEMEEGNNGSPILKEALAYLECTVRDRMECGDHWVVYATIDRGHINDPDGKTAVHHRKSGSYY
jgi:flavin reductase (DIM6/NTAB) family NADH-FMN oxidoreductase RutF